MFYQANKWYWIVENTDPATQVYSGAGANFVGVTDADYEAFLVDGGIPTKIPTQADLIWVFDNAGYAAGAAGLSASS